MNIRELPVLMNKQELFASLALALLLPVVAYIAWRLFLDPAGQAGHASEAVQRLGPRASLLLVAGYVWVRYRGNGQLVDERDRQIGGLAVRAGYMCLGLSLVVTACVVGLESWHGFVTSRSPAWVESFLMLCLLFSLAVNAWVRLFHYWRDRR